VRSSPIKPAPPGALDVTEPDEPDEEPSEPREPMEGGSDRSRVGDDVSTAATMGVCDGCDACDGISGCDGGGDCGFPLLRVSLLLAVAALLVPGSAAGPVMAAIRFYRRMLTRFTPVCPSTPSCSTFSLAAVERLGARRGLAAAAVRVRRCGRGR
jgi:uncharacterized protein